MMMMIENEITMYNNVYNYMYKHRRKSIQKCVIKEKRNENE